MSLARRDERGGVIVLMALGMVALTLMVAVVVDSASTRSIRRRARAAADASATAGVLDLTAASAVDACATAFAYAFTNLGVDQPSHGNIQSACSSATNGGMTAGAACTSGGPARVATVEVGDTTVQVTNPVPDTSPLLRATVVGGGYDQAADAGGGSIDGVDCQRLGVEITQPQSLIFGGVASSSNGRFSVHSVARYQPGLRKSNILPALIALEPTACKAVDAGSNGEIHVESTATGPGVLYSDSNGTSPACSASEGIFHAGNSATIHADKLSATVPGELAWYSATSRGSTPGRTTDEYGAAAANFWGRLYARDTRVGRTRADTTYNCGVMPVDPLTPCTSDPVGEADVLARRTTAPPGYAAPSTCSTSGAVVTISVNTFLNCDTFEVKNNPLVVTGGATVIFRGRLKLAGGTLAVNVASTTPPAGASALPISAADVQSRLIVGSTAVDAVDMNGGLVYMAETFLYSRGGFGLQSTSSKVLWSPASKGSAKSLLYWSESPNDFTFQGGPTFKAAGVVFHGKGPLKLGGNATIDLTEVQLWVKTVSLTGGPRVRLRPDPNNSINVGRAGSALIR
ncbi:MAG: hypothetical protein AVDCRST_MAG76-338 [uncultured Acidimicrobiales bacterium]|uniref:Uncharacterized protein n=1 Tax=uncultured Acidimicrobiales bacterium TaxID=310071 RepID=A0A6J4H6R2_9ACTN|nr:MAG: hypothetical protein AVDCRST_MAG76-338 [uncultured Acidimicrobiales bacterium]